MRRTVATLAAVVGLAAGSAACSRSADSLVDVERSPRLPLSVTVALAPEAPTFKVDGRLRLVWESASLPVAGTDLGVEVLPAGTREATFDLEVPFFRGILRLREETLDPGLPFLCGSTDAIDPRETSAATATIALCVP